MNVCLMLDKNFYYLKTRFFSKICFTLYCIAIGLILSDILMNKKDFFYLFNSNNDFFPYYTINGSIIIIFGNFFLISTFYFSYTSIKHLPKGFVDLKSFNLIFGATILILFVFMVDFLLQIYELSTINNYIYNINIMYFGLLNFISIVLAYFSYTQPYLHFSGGPRTNLLLEKGFIGYYLASLTDDGPTPMKYSKSFEKYSNLQLKSIIGLAVSSISVLGMFSSDTRGDSFSSKVSLLPIPGMANYSALTYTLFIKNSELKDERIKESAPTVYCILFPSNLTVALRKMDQTLEDVLKQVEITDNIEDFNDDFILSSLTNKILRKILL
jgi:hypothetical protein